MRILEVHSLDNILHNFLNDASIKYPEIKNVANMLCVRSHVQTRPRHGREIQLFMNSTRSCDKLDYTQELIYVLEKGGIDSKRHVKEAANEDTFLLSLDLIEQLK